MTETQRQLDTDEQLVGGSLASLQDRIAQYGETPTAESRTFSHETYPVASNQSEREPSKTTEQHDSLHLPGIHASPIQPHGQEFYQHNADHPTYNYSLAPNLQYQLINNSMSNAISHPQMHLGVHDITHYAQTQEALLMQALPQPEYHDHSQGPNAPAQKGQRKSRWRPTQKQKERLEAYWVENQYPDRVMKQKLATELEGVSAEQVSRWFKHRRESFAQKGKFQYRNEAAAKFSNEQIAQLENIFKSNTYPSRDDLKTFAEQMGVSIQRVKNWFKARRCRLAQKGEFDFKQATPRAGKRKGEESPTMPDAKRPELENGETQVTQPETMVTTVESVDIVSSTLQVPEHMLAEKQSYTEEGPRDNQSEIQHQTEEIQENHGVVGEIQ